MSFWDIKINVLGISIIERLFVELDKVSKKTTKAVGPTYCKSLIEKIYIKENI